MRSIIGFVVISAISGAKSKNKWSRVKNSPVKTYQSNAVHDKKYKKTTSHYEKLIILK